MSVRAIIVALDPVQFGLGLAVVAGVGLAAFMAGIRLLRHAVLVAVTPTSALGTAAQGFGEFEGRADLLPGPPIAAPLTGRVCAWYRCRVYERSQDRNQWGVVTDETSDGLFLLRDRSGTSVVDPEGARVTPSTKLTWYSDSLLTGLPAAMGSGLLASGRYRFQEERIELGTKLYVMGHYATHGASQEVPDTPAEIRALLNLWKRDQAGLLRRFDRNSDGLIDAGEWDQARKAAAEEVKRQQRERFGDGTVNLLSKPVDDRPFLISTVGEEQMLRRWRRLALLAFSAFVAAAGFAAWALSVRV